jgi:tetratricopeptide (TPR) repeat protein
MASGECVFTLFDEGQTREVNDMISEIEKQDADDITINLLKAVVLQSKKMNHEAIDYYQKILARKPDEPVILKAVAKLYGDIGDVENANRYLSKANELIEQ